MRSELVSPITLRGGALEQNMSFLSFRAVRLADDTNRQVAGEHRLGVPA